MFRDGSFPAVEEYPECLQADRLMCGNCLEKMFGGLSSLDLRSGLEVSLCDSCDLWHPGLHTDRHTDSLQPAVQLAQPAQLRTNTTNC